MKRVNIIPILLASLALLAFHSSATDKYTETMQKNIDAIYNTKTPDDFQVLINTFERIGAAEKTKWEPYYYAAYGNVMLAAREKEAAKKDSYLDLSLKAIEKGKLINSNESELITLEGFVHMIRVSVDPATRGQQYSGLAMQSYGKAISLNPDNPRALALMAQMQYGTAKFFGVSTVEACGINLKAIEKFETYASENPLAPKWGKSMAEGFKANCQ